MRIAATVLAVLVAASAFAAEVTGQWKASAPGPDGQTMELVFTLKAEGTALTGTVNSPMGEMAISKGKLEGDAISFDVDANGMTITHKGTVSGDTMKLKVEFGGAAMPPMDMTATRLPPAKSEKK
jgi:hypothetical protein